MRRLNEFKNLILLTLCMALATTASILNFAVSGLVGQKMLPGSPWVTLPLFLVPLVGTLVSSPYSFLMKRYSRRVGFLAGHFSMILAGGLGYAALLQESFVLFCVASAFLGIMWGSVPFYRFAAMESAPEDFKNQALSLVLLGGVLAAFIGPNLARFSEFWVSTQYAGNFLSLSIVGALSILLIWPVRISPLKEDEGAEKREAEPNLGFLRNPRYLLAVYSAAASFGVMSLLMGATPLAMNQDMCTFSQVAMVIQWHVLGMYAPSFITGKIIDRIGVMPVLILGGLCNLSAAFINMHGHSLSHYLIGLFMVGLGWNLLYVAATSLLTETFSEAQKAKAQAISETVTVSALAAGILGAGWMFYQFDWVTLNLIALFPIFFGMAGVVWVSLLKTNPIPTESAKA